MWHAGKALPNGFAEEFDEDCNTTLCDFNINSPHSQEDHKFTYADTDIDQLSEHLSIKWQATKLIPFGIEVPYLGFWWDLQWQEVHLPDEKKAKYLAAIVKWKEKHTHNLLETQGLYGKLLHTALVIPAGQAHLTSLEAMLASFNNNPFLLHTPS